MKKKIALALFFLSVFSFAVGARPLQNPGPLSKQEIISLLKQTAPKRSQADIVVEIEQRGIAFAVSDKVITELQSAGARSFLIDAVRRAGKNVGKPVTDPNDYGSDETRKQAETAAITKLPLVEQARRYALQYAGELPNFIVTQTVKRFVQSPDVKDWKVEDTLEIELTYREETGEQFKLLRINGKPARQSYDELDGSTSTGEFGSLLAAIFLPQSKTEFKQVKEESFNNRPTVVYDYKVKKGNTVSSITDKNSGQKTLAGFSGTIWIDKETARVLRVEAAHEGMPAGFPITLSENAVEFDWINIAGERYLLPVRAEVIMGRDRDRFYTRNVIEFKDYKKFEAKIKVPSDQ